MSENRITPPNYTQIPNVILDHWMGILSPAEFKVLMVICRKTFGWGKEIDAIPISQIVKLTSLHRSGIFKNLETLIGHGLIEKIKSKSPDGDEASNKYIVKVYSVGGGSLFSEPPLVDSDDHPVVETVDPQKKLYTKENIQKKERENPPKFLPLGKHVKLTQEEYDIFVEKYTEPYMLELIDRINDYIDSTGKVYKGWAATIRNWIAREPAIQSVGMSRAARLAVAPLGAGRNQQIAQQVVEKYKGKHMHGSIHAGPSSLEITFNGNTPSFYLPYTEHGFEEQLKNQLRKMGMV